MNSNRGPARSLQLLLAVVTQLDRQGVRYCILHGYQHFDERINSDIDCIVDPAVPIEELVLTLHSSDFRVVQHFQHESTCHYLVLYSFDSKRFLHLDVSSDYRRDGRVFFHGEEMLLTRRRHKQFWVPEPALEFGYYLVKKIAKGTFDHEHTVSLSELFALDPLGCQTQISRFWNPNSAAIMANAAESQSWSSVTEQLRQFRTELIAGKSGLAPGALLRYHLSDMHRRAKRVIRPTGLSVAFLGPDGSGKSTVIERVGRDLAPAFRRTDCRHLYPGLLRRSKSVQPVVDPHGLPERSYLSSLLKCLFWALEYSVGHGLRTRPKLVRSTLVLFDRYLPDVLVDRKRYRFSGPQWLVELIWRVVPKPDLVILLDAPTEVLRQRKQEVTEDETKRQRHDYLTMTKRFRNGYIISTDQPLDRVVADVESLVMRFLDARLVSRVRRNGR